jgi:type I restriction enzyme S subunit
MSTKWAKVKLADILKPIWRQEKVIPSSEYRLLGTRWYGGGLFIKEVCLGQQIRADRLYRVQKGNFVYNRLFAWKGSFALAGPESDGCYVSNEFPCFEVDQNYLDSNFLLWYFRREITWNEVLNLSTGATPTSRNRLKEKIFLNLEIPLPPFAEQRRIVAKIQQLAVKIAEARSLRQNAVGETEALLNANISQVFRSLAPFRKLVESNSCWIHCGQHLSPEEQSESGIPYITGPADFGPRVAAPSRFARASRTLAHPGDVLLTVKGAGVGKVNFAPPFPTAIGRQLYALRPSVEKLDQAFLWYALQFRLQHFRDAITATTVPGIGRSDVEGLEIPIPPLLDQRWIVAKLDALYVQVDVLKRLQAETTAELDALLPSILDKGFKGEL